MVAPRVTSWSHEGTRARPGLDFLNEAAARGRWSLLSDSRLGHYLHVDDGVFLGPGSEKAAVHDRMIQAADALEDVGFEVPDRRGPDEVEKLLGYSFDAGMGRLSLPEDKAWMLREAFRWMGSQAVVCTQALSTLVGI